MTKGFQFKWLFYAAVFVIGATAVGLALGLWAYKNLSIGVPLEDQPFQISILEPFDAKVQVNKPLDAQIEGVLDANIPLKTQLNVPFYQTLHPTIIMDTYAPVKLTVPVKQTLTIDQVLPVDTKVEVKLLGKWISLPLKGDIPIKLDVPLDLKVPVDQMVKLKFSSVVETRFKEKLKLPIDQQLNTPIKVQGAVNVPLEEDLDATINIDEPLDVVIDKGQLDLPLDTLSLTPNKPQPSP